MLSRALIVAVCIAAVVATTCRIAVSTAPLDPDYTFDSSPFYYVVGSTYDWEFGSNDSLVLSFNESMGCGGATNMGLMDFDSLFVGFAPCSDVNEQQPIGVAMAFDLSSGTLNPPPKIIKGNVGDVMMSNVVATEPLTHIFWWGQPNAWYANVSSSGHYEANGFGVFCDYYPLTWEHVFFVGGAPGLIAVQQMHDEMNPFRAVTFSSEDIYKVDYNVSITGIPYGTFVQSVGLIDAATGELSVLTNTSSNAVAIYSVSSVFVDGKQTATATLTAQATVPTYMTIVASSFNGTVWSVAAAYEEITFVILLVSVDGSLIEMSPTTLVPTGGTIQDVYCM